MSIIKKNIRFTGNDVNIQIPIGNNSEFTGYQQEIDEFVNIKSTNSINDAVDGEVTKFTLKDEGDTKYISFIYSLENYSYIKQPNYVFAGFEKEDVEKNNLNFLNSFYIMDFFDTYNPENQTKIFSTYITNLNSYVRQSGPLPSSVYTLLKDFQLYNLYIPIGYLNISTYPIYEGYVRFSFYNGKTGKLTVFYNKDNKDLESSKKMFFKTQLDLENKTWKFQTPSFNDSTISTAFAEQLATSDDYIERFNDTFENIDNLKQKYPTESIFDYRTGKYI